MTDHCYDDVGFWHLTNVHADRYFGCYRGKNGHVDRGVKLLADPRSDWSRTSGMSMQRVAEQDRGQCKRKADPRRSRSAITSACTRNTYQHSAATGIPIREVSTKNIVNPVLPMMKPDVPASKAAGKGTKRSQKGILAGGKLRRGERRHVVNEHNLREGVGETFYADCDGEGPEIAAAVRG
jgi:hypothetical protein